MGKKYLEAFKHQKSITYSQVCTLACTCMVPEAYLKSIHGTAFLVPA